VKKGLWLVLACGLALGSTGVMGRCDGWKVERLPGTYKFTEGPVWTPWGTLIFSDTPADRIYEIAFGPDGRVKEPNVYREPSGGSNGLTFDKQGRLIACEHFNRRVTRTEKDGKITVLADKYEGKRLNSPNDVVVKSDGTIYFTDPSYGIKPEQQELAFKGVYRIKTDGKLELLVKDFDMPNGLCFSPDEARLYIADSSSRRHIRVFKVGKDGTLSGGEVVFTFPNTGVPDGMKIGPNGELFSSGPGGVWIFDSDGKHLQTIPVPETPANLAWGNKDKTVLYITARTGVYRATVN